MGSRFVTPCSNCCQQLPSSWCCKAYVCVLRDFVCCTVAAISHHSEPIAAGMASRVIVCCVLPCRGDDLFGLQQHLDNWLLIPTQCDILFVRWDPNRIQQVPGPYTSKLQSSSTRTCWQQWDNTLFCLTACSMHGSVTLLSLCCLLQV